MDNADAVRAIFEEGWNQQEFDRVDGVFADEFEFHIGGRARTMTVNELREIVARWHAGFPDFRFDIHAVVASGERAAIHATLCGIHRGHWNNLAPTGRSINVEHMFFLRFEDGLVVEVWELLDGSELRRQLTGQPS